MLRILTGPFHPDLERALADDVRQLKAADPLAPLAIIVPSGALRRRLTWLLSAEHQLALLDVRVLTFHMLAVCLLQEAGASETAAVHTEFFFKELIHHVLRRQDAPDGTVGDASPWAGLVEMPGAWGALWATVKDLKDAAVPEDLDLEGALHAHNVEWPALRRLLRLYREVLAARSRMSAWDRDDLVARAVDCVSTSVLLGRQRRILYYGFYDLTQVQLDLFQAVAKIHPTTLYFPLVKDDPSFAFAGRFFERYLHGLATEIVRRPEAGDLQAVPSSLSTPRPVPRVIDVSGHEDEVTIVAKAILGLVEERGYGFHEIGVIVRTLTGYDQVIPRVFGRQGIPFVSSIGRPLVAFPLVKTAIQLLHLRVEGFRREDVVDVLASEFLRLPALCPDCDDPRPDLWDLASRRLAIVKGVEEWRRLDAFSTTGVPLRDNEDQVDVGPRIPAEQVRALASAVRRLDDALAALPERATWEEYMDRIRSLLEGLLDFNDDQDAGEAMRAALEQLRALGQIGGEVPLSDCVAAFCRLMEETSLPLEDGERGSGVQVLDAMAARGLPFRALFILGLNEKVFPRHIQEDAFLRDRVRRVLEADLGYKIQEKLAGYDEEKLLFHLLMNSAREELTLVYQRTDQGGRPLVPSDYLADVRPRGTAAPDFTVPRRMADKFAHTHLPHYGLDRLTAAELTLRLLLERRVPRRLLAEAHPAGGMVTQGLVATRALDRGRPNLGPHDGITGPLPDEWTALRTRGLSPTSIESYATCPFRYFAGHVLRLDVLNPPESVVQIGPPERGMLAHAILTACLETLRERGCFAVPAPPSVDPLAVLAEVARPIFQEFARTHPVGYSLVWELEQESLVGFLKQVLTDDLAEMRSETGPHWQPILFEAAMEGTLTVPLAGGAESFPLRGRLDRVDWCSTTQAYRIVDYKYKAGSQPGTLDRNLQLAAVRALRLQPPFYLKMAQATMPGLLPRIGGLDVRAADTPRCENVWFYYLAPNWEHKNGQGVTRVPFPGDAWESSLRGPLSQAVSLVLGGIRAGRFFIYPADYCDRCDYRVICHKTHQPTGWRARADHEMVQPHRTLRRARVANLSETGEKGERS